MRATAWSLLRGPLTRGHVDAVRQALGNPDPLIRLGALRAVAELPPDAAVTAAALLDDSLLAVRLAAFEALAPIQSALPGAQKTSLDRVQAEFVATQLAMSERPEAHGNLGNAYAAGGDFVAAEAAYRRGLEFAPDAVGLRMNLADLYRRMGRDDEAESLIRDGIAANDAEAALHHTLGLLLVRKNQPAAALAELSRAAQLAPGEARFVYVYAIALNSTGDSGQAMAVIEDAAIRFPGDFDIGFAQVTLLREAGQIVAARDAAAMLVERYPGNDNALRLLRSFDDR